MQASIEGGRETPARFAGGLSGARGADPLVRLARTSGARLTNHRTFQALSTPRPIEFGLVDPCHLPAVAAPILGRDTAHAQIRVVVPDGRRPRIHLAICGLSLVPRQGVLAPTLADRLDRAMSRIGDLAPGAGTCRIEGDIVQAADADTAFRFWAAPSRPKHFETRRRTRDEPDAICHLVDARPLRRALPEKRR